MSDVVVLVSAYGFVQIKKGVAFGTRPFDGNLFLLVRCGTLACYRAEMVSFIVVFRCLLYGVNKRFFCGFRGIGNAVFWSCFLCFLRFRGVEAYQGCFGNKQ